ncbi:unnamed protein product [Linum trigynum]|uniref:Replication protein A 70 kDa DNA-binding subunit B/D first OB fold domain-containing protein n=1 Tax=Linum trigynum TaxID=586398 RepID=A0AAV2DZ47_9ROSI
MSFASISQLVPTLQSKCRLRVRILRVWPTQSMAGDTIYWLNLLLIDCQGAECQGMIFSFYLPKFDKKIEEGKIYAISNFEVDDAPKRDRVTVSTIYITLTAKTVVEELVDASDIKKYSFKFLKSTDFATAYANDQYLSDLVGEVDHTESTVELLDGPLREKTITVYLKLIE